MLLSQFLREDGGVQIVARDGPEAYRVRTTATLYEVAQACIAEVVPIREYIAWLGLGTAVDLEAIYAAGRMLPPVAHPDPAHLHLTGTGMTHLGSATLRAAMHGREGACETDSMRMFQLGLAGGKPTNAAAGVQPEWFYKGNGTWLVAPGARLAAPDFAEACGEEPEIAGVYLIAPDGMPVRLGFALANELCDHAMERRNYLYLAHSKLRPAAIGPELLVGDLPPHIEGTSRILRGERVVFEAPFLSGEANMSHSLANLEHHHFKYAPFRQPGDLHVHMFGSAAHSVADGIAAQDGDIFEIAAAPFGLPLRNRLTFTPRRAAEPRTAIRIL
ncbi:AraD1 family protein [Acuticoccus sp. I52.16.1]|uniref:AraD1 family protein n=1 Tax=Acuticoccus sp. I52.16.1 TaxID=2928472 RepID=UPI001FCFD0B8|nr:AraD1 family protein [Acuticoccus sp. I52.16.1]UOM36224.1 GguC protein [Acuticoccus sp. I52.16.1]